MTDLEKLQDELEERITLSLELQRQTIENKIKIRELKKSITAAKKAAPKKSYNEGFDTKFNDE